MSLYIHQIWLQGEKELPANYRELSRGYKEMPGFKYKLWSDQQIRHLIKKHFPKILSAYDGYPYWVMKVDLGKYVILALYGGFYVDMDTAPLQNLRGLLTKKKILVNRIPQNLSFGGMGKKVTPYVINNNFFYCDPSDTSFFYHLIKKAHRMRKRKFYDFKANYILSSIGPVFVTDTYNDLPQKKRDEVDILSAEKIKDYIKDFEHATWKKKNKMDLKDTQDNIIRVGFLTLVVLLLFVLIGSRRK